MGDPLTRQLILAIRRKGYRVAAASASSALATLVCAGSLLGLGDEACLKRFQNLPERPQIGPAGLDDLRPLGLRGLNQGITGMSDPQQAQMPTLFEWSKKMEDLHGFIREFFKNRKPPKETTWNEKKRTYD